jgi:hypothetical protein
MSSQVRGPLAAAECCTEKMRGSSGVNRPLSRPDVRHRCITSVDSGLRGPRRAGRYRGRVRWAAGPGRAAPRSPPGAGRDHPSSPAWGLLARAVDPSPRGASQAAPRGGAGQRQRMATLLPAHCGVCPSPDPPQPVQLRYQRPAAAPGTAGRRGCRTAGRGCCIPGSASRRSAECTDAGRRASASRCIYQQVHL